MRTLSIFFLCLLFFSCSTGQSPAPETSGNGKLHSALPADTLSAEKTKTDSLHSEITCPKCGYKKTELLPTEVCLLKYTCQSCRYEMLPKEGDCCVFCTYGNVKCPSMQ